MTIRLCEVQGGRQLLVSHAQQHLVHAGDASGGRGVSDVGLHGSQPTELLAIRPLFEYGGQGLQLNRIAQFGSRSVGFHKTDTGGIDAIAVVNIPLQFNLAIDAGRGDTVGFSVLIDARTDD